MTSLFSKIKYLIISLRPHHWVKNGFIWIPIIFGKKLNQDYAVLNVAISFALFCLLTSAVYLVNDIFDRNRDSSHEVKKNRPIAAGKISPITAGAFAGMLAAFVFLYVFVSVPEVAGLFLAYAVINLAYSLLLKHQMLIDVFCLSSFYLIRIMIGSAACSVVPSHWLIMMIFLLSLFLGFAKRRDEHAACGITSGNTNFKEEKYSQYLLNQIEVIIMPSIAIVYMLYTVDRQTVGFFGSSNLIYTVPFVYFGLFRYLYLIHVKGESTDPTHVFLSDQPMQVTILSWIIACISIIYA